MYSEKTIITNLEEFEARNGWMPVYHTFEEIQQFKAYVNSLTSADANSKNTYYTITKPVTQKRQDEIKRWVENEQALCGLDFEYWASRYAYVCDEQGQIRKFKTRLSQKIYQSVIQDFDEKRVSIELLILKGRQLGVTTFTALMFIHRLLFVPHTQAIMASVKSTASELIERILDTAYDNSPWWLIPNRLPKRQFDNGSVLSIQSGMQATGLAQGWTPTLAHLCLKSTTYIQTQGGIAKKIKDILPGDMVLTSRGKLMPVKASVKSGRQNEVSCEIALWGNYDSLVVTRDHPILTPEGFKSAETLDKHDYVVMPVRKISHAIKTITLEHNGRSRPKKGEKKRQEAVDLTKEWGWMCGLYLAEGSAHKNNRWRGDNWDVIHFSIHNKEVQQFKAALHDAFGPFQHIRASNLRGSSSTLTVHNAALARWLVNNFGHLADGKRIPDWVFDAGVDFIHGLLQGYLQGDGHVPDNAPTITGCSISLPLLLQVRSLFASCGFGWSCLYHDDAGIRYGRNCRERWQLQINGDYARKLRSAMGFKEVKRTTVSTNKSHHAMPKHWKYSADGKSILIEVFENRAVECEEFYDLEVDAPEHDFCTIHCCVKNSELADIPDPKKTIEEGLFRAMHSSPHLFMVLEGTGGGNTGWLADTWRAAKSDWPKRQHRLCPIFIPWPMCPEIYPPDGWLRKFPIENFGEPLDVTRKHVSRCESYVRNTPYLAKIAGKNYKMPAEQQWFWQFNYLQACKNHTQKTWASQMPADDFESLTGVHDSVFDEDVIQEVEEKIYEITGDKKVRRKPVQNYAIVGHDIDDDFYPLSEDIDDNQQIIRVGWTSNRGQNYQWDLIPLKDMDEEVERNTMDRLIVYEEPRKGNNYSCGIDTADGLGEEDEDRSVISVTKNKWAHEYDSQVAEYTTNRLNSAQITAFAAAVGAWYSPACPDSRGIKFAIEQIRGPGDTCQHQLKMMGFNNHHDPQRYDGKKIVEKNNHKQGFYSSSWSVSMLMGRFVEAVNGGWYVPKSRWLIEELRTLERHNTAGRSKMEHRSGQHDDRVRAAAMAYFTVHDKDVLAERAQKRYDAPKKRQPVSKGVCTTATVGVGDWD